MNIRLCNGKIPIQTGDERHPIMLVDPPDRELFDSLFYRGVPMERKDIYWDILNDRLGGLTLKDVSLKHKITRERVRQIEAKIIRRLTTHLLSELASEIAIPETIRPLHDHH